MMNKKSTSYDTVKANIKYPYLIISDIHLHNWSTFANIDANGINDRLQVILDAIKEAAYELRSVGGSDVVITGDLFHTRGSVKPSVLNPAVDLFKLLAGEGFTFHFIAGNHDLEGKESDRLGNAASSLGLIDGFNIYDTITLVDDKFLFIPWIEKAENVYLAAKNITSKKRNLTIFCHVGLSGVVPSIIGNVLNPDDILKLEIDKLFAGHFHNHVNFHDKIFSVGALTHQTWRDVNSVAGYLIVYEDKVVQKETKAPKFMLYDDTATIKNNYVKIKNLVLTDEEAADLVQKIKKDGCLAVLDQSERPTVVSRDFSVKVDVDDTFEKSLMTYCKHVYDEENWEAIYNECLDLTKSAAA